MKSLKLARFIARSAAFEVSRRYSERDLKHQFVKQLKSRRVDVVFDVGANSGQYAAGLRRAAYKGRIVSFEPLSGPFTILESKASTDPLWDCRQHALGDSDGTVTINIAGNAGQSSSVLPMLKSHQNAFPPANYVGTQEASIHRLDSVA
ncbi:FkbM family methyltransferase, partial [Mycobacterium tuberculosis 2229BH]